MISLAKHHAEWPHHYSFPDSEDALNKNYQFILYCAIIHNTKGKCVQNTSVLVSILPKESIPFLNDWREGIVHWREAQKTLNQNNPGGHCLENGLRMHSYLQG